MDSLVFTLQECQLDESDRFASLLAAAPIVRFAEAVNCAMVNEPLREAFSHCDYIAECMTAGREAVRVPREPLSVEEIAAIHIVTMRNAFFKELRSALRDSDHTRAAPFLPFAKLLLSVLHKLPPITGPILVYRFAPMLTSHFTVGTRMVWWAFTPTDTRNIAHRDIILHRAAEHTILEIKVCHAYDLGVYSCYPWEGLWLPPHTELVVAGVQTVRPGLRVVQLWQLPYNPLIPMPAATVTMAVAKPQHTRAVKSATKVETLSHDQRGDNTHGPIGEQRALAVTSVNPVAVAPPPPSTVTTATAAAATRIDQPSLSTGTRTPATAAKKDFSTVAAPMPSPIRASAAVRSAIPSYMSPPNPSGLPPPPSPYFDAVNVRSILGAMEECGRDRKVQSAGCEALRGDWFKITNQLAGTVVIKAVVHAMTTLGSDESVAEHACGLLCDLTTTDPRAEEIMAIDGCLDAVLDAMDEHVGNASVVSNALGFIIQLATRTDHQSTLKEEGLPVYLRCMAAHRCDVRIQEQCCNLMVKLGRVLNGENVYDDGVLTAVMGAMEWQPDSAAVQKAGCDAVAAAVYNCVRIREASAVVNGEALTAAVFAAMQRHPTDRAVQIAGCKALFVIQFLVTGSDLIVQCGGLPLVLNALTTHSECDDVVEVAIVVLRLVARDRGTHQKLLLMLGSVDAVVNAMQTYPNHEGIQEQGCTFLLAIRKSMTDEHLRTAGAIKVLEGALQRHPNASVVAQASKDALGYIRARLSGISSSEIP